MTSMTDHSGRCHCGATGFRYRTEIPPARWSIRACQCTFCRANDALSTSDPDGSLEFTAREAAQLRRYRFGLGTADFLFCGNCGIYLGAVIDTSAGRFGIVNTHALETVPAQIAEPVPADYGAEDAAARVDRRERYWTPVTDLPAS